MPDDPPGLPVDVIDQVEITVAVKVFEQQVGCILNVNFLSLAEIAPPIGVLKPIELTEKASSGFAKKIDIAVSIDIADKQAHPRFHECVAMKNCPSRTELAPIVKVLVPADDG